jgi:hypothetical protein
LVELLAGYLLFPAPLDVPDEHLLGMMIVLLGPFPVEVVRSGKYFHQEIAQLGKLTLPIVQAMLYSQKRATTRYM